jgi:hypothetical protein
MENDFDTIAGLACVSDAAASRATRQPRVQPGSSESESEISVVDSCCRQKRGCMNTLTAKPKRAKRQRPSQIAWCVAMWYRAARHPIVATAALVAMSLASIAIITAATGIPEPQIHDELAQLIQADIFVHGRLAARPHQFWQHFETFHVLSQPTYQAKFPPGPALAMALGQRLTGEPIVGVWLSVVAMIGAMTYAFYAWLPPRWAILGTALVVLRFGVVGTWAHSYWGGAFAAAAGALALGAIGRLVRVPTTRDGTLFGIGLVALAWSRPFEGLAYVLPALAMFGWRLVRPWPNRRRLWRTALPATFCVCLAGLAWLGYYNWRVTGAPLKLPYLAYEESYSGSPLFLFQHRRVPGPTFRHREMENWERGYAMPITQHAEQWWPVDEVEFFGTALINYLTPILLIVCFGFWFARNSIARSTVLPATCLASMFVAMLFSLWSAPRYVAPATASIFALTSIGISGLSRANLRWCDGRVILAAALLVFAAGVPVVAAIYVVEARQADDWSTDKRAVRERLLQLEGDDLVFVRYAPEHNVHAEWVYNRAVVDRQPIVWAREISPDSDAQLREYFRSRRAWIVFADEKPARLVEWKTGQ